MQNKPQSCAAWSDVTLGSVVKFLSGGTPFKGNSEFWGGSIPWVSAKDMKRFRLSDTKDCITPEGAANGTRVVSKGSVLLLTRGMTLLKSVPVCVIERDMAFNQDIRALRAGPRIHTEYLPYLVLGNTHRLKGLVDLAGHGTGRLNSGDLRGLSVRLPPVNEQRAIAHILGTLDDKIELNRRMNETLETIARAIFKDWFVDFGPTRTKMKGCEPYLPPGIWSLFPDALDNEGKPEGWEFNTLARLAATNPESWTTRHHPPVVEYVDLSNAKWGNIRTTILLDWEDAPSRARRVSKAGDTIVGTTRPGNGSFAYISRDGLTVSTGFAVLSPLAAKYRDAVYLAATSTENINRLASLAYGHGGTYPAVKPVEVSDTAIVFPGDDVLAAFAKLVSPIRERAEHSNTESQMLTQTRDLLLPKLISGEIRPHKVNYREVEACTR